MTVNPIIPIPIMAVICIAFIAIKRKGKFPFIRQIIMVILLFMINLRIMIPNDELAVKVHSVEANVLFVIDDTISMVARDYEDGKPRLDGAKKDCEYIIDRMTGSKFAVVSFHNNGQILCPYSKETEFVKNTINAIYPLDVYSAKGSNFEVSKENIMNMLNQGEKMSNGYNVVFFISDGEDNKNDKLPSFAEAGKLVNQGAVLGYGTEKGGKMYARSYNDAEETVVQYYDYDNGYTDAISKINEKNLEKIADDLGVQYVHMTDQKRIDSIIDDILANVEKTTKEDYEQGYDETYYFFAIALLGMFIWEFFLLHKKIRENRI